MTNPFLLRIDAVLRFAIMVNLLVQDVEQRPVGAINIQLHI